jgi:hypothetical protein
MLPWFLIWQSLYRRESILALYIIFPSQNNNVQCVFRYCTNVEMCNIFYQCAKSACWPTASVVLAIRFRITWPGVRWAPPPPPPFPALDRHWTAYLTLASGLNPQTSKPCHMDLWLARLVLTHLHLHRLHPFLLQQQPLEPRVSIFLSPCCFLWGAASALLCVP